MLNQVMPTQFQLVNMELQERRNGNQYATTQSEVINGTLAYIDNNEIR
jgi:hypothetical protein